MHGLILRTLQIFLLDTYGQSCWRSVIRRARIDVPEFEAMLTYDAALAVSLLEAAEEELGKPRDAICEDIGTYLVSHPNCESLRRLLRFGGVDFVEFLHSLDDLPDRARLAVADLSLPALELGEFGTNEFRLRSAAGLPGFGHVMVGVLRAMADDYGALAILDHRREGDGSDVICITLVETAFAEGRDFALAAGHPPAREDVG